MIKQIYLDYNATAPLRPQAAAMMQEVMALPFNPSSMHAYGRKAKKYVEDARKIIADSISAWPNEIIFTASGTEANNMALRSQAGRCVLVSAIEHSSILQAAPEITRIGVDGRGIVKLEELDRLLRESPTPALVSLMLANNETGVVQPLAQISEITRRYAALLHTDAVQALGKIPLDFGALGVDMLTLSAHKCGGPLGAAALVVRNNLAVRPLLCGGGQERGQRAGTENVPAIAGFGSAVESLHHGSAMPALEQALRRLEREATKAAPGAIVFSQDVERLANTSCISMPGVSSEIQLMNFDLAGFAVSAGSACSSGKIGQSHVLQAMGYSPEIAASAIRISVGWNTDANEIDAFAGLWQKTWQRLGKAP